jgi:hypothetical protein
MASNLRRAYADAVVHPLLVAAWRASMNLVVKQR